MRTTRVVSVAGLTSALVLGTATAVQAPPVRMLGPRWSPDGRRIVFEANLEVPQRLDLYVIGADGQGMVKLRDDGRNGSWSRDGSRLLFASASDGDLDIYEIGADGQGLRQLTNDSTMDYLPAWSPDGRRIAFVSIARGAGQRHDVYVMNADGTGRTAVTQTPAEDMGPAWASNREIVFYSNRDGNWEIYSATLGGGEARRLTDDPGADMGPAVSPDGRLIAFTTDRGGSRGIWRMGVDGSDAARIGTSTGASLAWSPDGRRIAYAAQVDGSWGIFVMNADGSEPRRITPVPAPRAAPANHLARLRWLSGCWELRTAQRSTIEMWMPPDGNTMLGASRTVTAGSVREFEFLRLEATSDTSLIYTALPSGQRETAFRSSAVSDSGFTVDNPAHDFPQRIIYRRQGADSLIARIEGPGPNGTRGADYAMRRASCASQ